MLAALVALGPAAGAHLRAALQQLRHRHGLALHRLVEGRDDEVTGFTAVRERREEMGGEALAALDDEVRHDREPRDEELHLLAALLPREEVREVLEVRRPRALAALVERFDRRGTEPNELFRSEFGQRYVRIQEFFVGTYSSQELKRF